MKRILSIVLCIGLVLTITGCVKKVDKMTFTQFNEYFFTNKYDIIDNTNKYGIETRRYFEAGDGKIQFFYIEFDNNKNAKKYIEGMYSNQPGSKTKVTKDYTYIKNTKNQYMKLYNVDNVIFIGITYDKKYKRQVNKVLKDLGY